VKSLVFTLDGVPMLYSGMEVGDVTESGGPALFEPLKVLWQIAERRPEFLRFYREMIALRHGHKALQQGETQWLDNSDTQRILSFLRKSGEEQFLVVINSTNRPFIGTVAFESGAWEDVTPGIEAAKRRPPSLPALSLQAWEFRIYQGR